MSLKVQIKKDVQGFSLDVSFQVENEFAVLFGASGSGKTMTLNAIAGLFQPDEGQISLGDRLFFQDRKSLFPPQKRELGYIFQNHSLFPHLTVWENVLFGGRGMQANLKINAAENFIRKFNLQGLEHKKPCEISGGQAQRVALARALMNKPKALLLDEPFSALDTPTRVAIGQCLRDVMKELHIPVVLVTHDIYEACAMADKMIVVDQGRILQIGTAKEVYEKPTNEHVRKLVRLDRHLEFRNDNE